MSEVAALQYPCFFFFNAATTPEIYTLSLHDALPICAPERLKKEPKSLLYLLVRINNDTIFSVVGKADRQRRSEEHTSELQSRRDLVCRLLLEKKKKRRCRSRRLSRSGR